MKPDEATVPSITPKEADMPEEKPKADNYVISKTWDEAMADVPASGEAEKPVVKPTTKEARNNGGATDK